MFGISVAAVAPEPITTIRLPSVWRAPAAALGWAATVRLGVFGEVFGTSREEPGGERVLDGRLGLDRARE